MAFNRFPSPARKVLSPLRVFGLGALLLGYCAWGGAGYCQSSSLTSELVSDSLPPASKVESSQASALSSKKAKRVREKKTKVKDTARVQEKVQDVPVLPAGENPSDLVPSQHFLGKPEVVAVFNDAMPTGVAVSFSGRRFVNFPRWEDNVPFTVGELSHGKVQPYPDAAFNKLDLKAPENHLISVQSVVVDARDRLWLLDTGSVKFGTVIPGGAKLVCVDLSTNQVIKTIRFPADVALPTSYLNDVRFDLRRGKAGMAFITDSSSSGHNALVVVDLASGESFRRLVGHASTRAVPGFLPIVEGAPLMFVHEDGERTSMKVGADGIAVGADGKHLFYCPLSSRKLYSVNLDALADRNVSDDDVAKTVCEVTEKGASDGLEMDSAGRIYATDYEHNAVHRISLEGKHETLVCDPRVLWPDTLCLAQDGYLYFTANQLHRQPLFHGGRDLREKPYVLFRVKVDAEPVLLR